MLWGLIKMAWFLVTLPIRFLITLTRFAAFLILPIVILRVLRMMVIRRTQR
jgi:hypothetical protein